MPSICMPRCHGGRQGQSVVVPLRAVTIGFYRYAPVTDCTLLWPCLGLVPRQHSTCGKQRLGRTMRMGQRDIRTLLNVGAMSKVRWACLGGCPEGNWLAGMLAHKPPMLVAIALANGMARSIWAMMTRQEDYKVPPTVEA